MTNFRRLATVGLLAIAISGMAAVASRPVRNLALGTTVSTDAPKATPHRRGARTVSAAVVSAPITVATAPRSSAAKKVLRGTPYRRPGEAIPRSLQVIPVPVPAELGAGRVGYAVSPSGRADVLSARAGNLEAAPVGDRTTTVVARVPPDAPAGPLEVARVEFTNDTITTIVSVELTVTRVHRLSLRTLRPNLAMNPGNRLRTTILAQNLGNASDTIQIVADGLPGWRIEPTAAVIVAPGEQKEIEIRGTTPPPPANGTFLLHLRAVAGSSELASMVLSTLLLPDPSAPKSHGGPLLLAGLGMAAGDSTGSSPVVGMSIEGPLSERVSLRGRFVRATDPADFNTQAMSRIGYFQNSSYLNASGPSWTITGGHAGYTFSPLFGWSLSGLGVAGEVTHGPWTFGGLATEQRVGNRSGGNLMGARATHTVPHGQVSATVTHLQQTLFNARSLDAAGLSYAFAPRPDLTLTAEAGYRSSDVGSGVGVSGRLEQHSERNRTEFYAAHAPGGSGAFARATDEINGNLWHRLSRDWAVQSFAYATTDDPGTGATSRSRGAMVGPSLRVGDQTSFDLSLSARDNVFTSATRKLANGELMASLGARTNLGRVSVNGAVGVGQSSRTTTLDTLGESTTAGARLVTHAGAYMSTSRGTFALDGGVEKNDPITGQVPTLGFGSLSASAVRLFHSARMPSFDAIVWYNAYEGAPKGGPAVRIGTQILLPSQFALTIDAERNPYLGGAGHTPWVAAIRLERSFGLPGLRRPVAQGRVFDDLNGNGVDDQGEHGIGGVMVRRGMSTMVTGPDGSYRFFGGSPADGIPTVDVTSLAAGQVAAAGAPQPGTRRRDLPVRRTTPVRVVLVPTADTLGRTPTTPLARLTVLATDTMGTVWIAHPDSGGVATFDALPAGRYTVTVDFSGSLERLRPLQGAAVIDLGAGTEVPPVRIPFGFRAVRVFDGSAPGSGGRRR